jgi:hypothetical protein
MGVKREQGEKECVFLGFQGETHWGTGGLDGGSSVGLGDHNPTCPHSRLPSSARRRRFSRISAEHQWKPVESGWGRRGIEVPGLVELGHILTVANGITHPAVSKSALK